MSRVATVPLQLTLSNAIQRAQGALAKSQTELATQKKASDFSALGTETVRNLSAHTMLAQQSAQTAVSKGLGTTLSLYASNISNIESSASDLRQQILTAVGTGQAGGLQDAIDSAFQQFRNSLNGSEGGVPLFGGSQTSGNPFQPQNLTDVASMSASQAFTNDGVVASARVADGVDVTYGVTASGVGTDLYSAFQTLAAAGPIGNVATPAQLTALNQAMGQLDTGLSTVRAVDAENGRKQAQVDTLAERGDQRSLLLQGVISDNEDADLGQVAADLSQQQTVLQASYSVFSKLSGLSLVNYLR